MEVVAMNLRRHFTGIFLAVAVLASTVLIPKAAVPALISEVLQFNAEGKFTVLQLADIQENGEVEPEIIDLITKAIVRYNPDIVVFTGDNIRGFISSKSFKSAVDQFLAPLLASNTKFAVTFGNHDDTGVWPTNPGTREEQYAYYKVKGGSLFVDHDVPALEGTGSGSIPVYAFGQNTETPAFQLFLMDSGTYINVTLDLDGVRTSQIDYYMVTNPSVPSLWFQHIPVPELYNLLYQVPAGTANSYEGSHDPFNDYTWALNTSLIDWKASGSNITQDIYKEAPGPTNLDTYQGDQYRSSAIYGSKTVYEAWLANGNMKGAFFGHNHTNSFVGTTMDGVTLGYAKAATLQGYNDGDPGIRVFEIDDSGSYTTISVTRSLLNNYGVGDYSAVNNAISAACVMKSGETYFRANNMNDPHYFNPSSTTVGNGVYPPDAFIGNASDLQSAIDAVEHNLDSRSQHLIDAFAASITAAWQSLSLKDADYSAVYDLLAIEDQDKILAPQHYSLTHTGQMLPVSYYTNGTLDNWHMVKASVRLNLKIPEQAAVNAWANSLAAAYEALRLKPEYERGNLAAAPGTSTVVNYDSLYIYGLFPGITKIEFESDFVRIYGNGHLECDYQPHGFGTGTKVRLINNLSNAVIYTYALLIFGDVNGDGNVDDGDSGQIVDFENYLYDWSENSEKLRAGDINGDGVVDSIDAGIITDVQNYLIGIDQITGRCF